MQGPVPSQSANVYRDAAGVPHITAASEQTAWYALGYEQARDGLLWIQYACKAAKGELTWVRGDGAGLQNDLAVKVLGAHLGGRTPSQLRTLLSPANPAITANFYDNCVAFAAGANAYRDAVANAPVAPLTPERQLRNWLDTNRIGPGGQPNLSWVYSPLHPIDVADIVSQGGWTAAIWSLFPFEYSVVNSSGPSYAFQGGAGAAVDPGLEVAPLAPATGERLLQELRQHVSQLPGAPSAMSGSNSFAWSGLYCSTANGTTYPGLLADPHQGLPFYGPSFAGTATTRGQFSFTPNHMWFAHVQVTPSGASQPTLDVFGHFPYAAAAAQSGHNRSLAMGGTAGAPNYADRFVLRLREDPLTGQFVAPGEFYSYYHDTAPGTNTTYQTVTAHSAPIKRPDNSVVQLPYWRAQSFGFILPDLKKATGYLINPSPGNQPVLSDVVVYGERVATNQPAPPWRARVANRNNPSRQPLPKMRFWRAAERDTNNNLITSPMVVTVRCPMDAAVAGNPLVPGENIHWQLLRDFWEISHATSVTEVIPRTNGAAYSVNVCFVDRGGATFSTQLSAIPKRGDDAALRAQQYSSLDKYLIYSGEAGPVPARHFDDKKFDWQFTSQAPPQRPAPLEYLEYPPGWAAPSPPAQMPSFKPATLQIPTVPSAFPPTIPSTGSGASFKIEGGFFASASNDQVWGYSRKSDGWRWTTTTGYSWVDIDSGNWLLQKALEAGSAYQSAALWFEGPDRQQIVVDRFTRRAQGFYQPSDPQVLPPLTPAEMRDFVVTPRLHNTRDYTPPAGAIAQASLPTPIRQLNEVVANQGYQQNPLQTEPADPLLRARRELQFFSDFWTELNNPQSSWNSYAVQPGMMVNLRQLWVAGGDPAHPAHANQVFWYDGNGVPRWIDLPPDFPLIDFVWQDSELGDGFTVGAAMSASTPAGDWNQITALVNNLVTWEAGASAADMYKMRPSSPGACLLEMWRMGYNATGATYGRHWRRLARGIPVSPLRWQPWVHLRGLASPDSQYASLLSGGLNPPYHALYANGQNGAIKNSLTPQDTNALVKFFLELGGHYIHPDYNSGSPSRKLARWQLAAGDIETFLGYLPGSYPLTGGLERITVFRRLLDTYAFLGSTMPALSNHFRSRAYDHTGQQLWPDPMVAADAACFGGALRAIEWYDDAYANGFLRDRGFQPKFIGMSGSYATLLVLFPSAGAVESHFWCTPGVQAMGSDLRGASLTARRFDINMGAFAANTLVQSRFSDFLTNYVTICTHYYP